MMALALAGCQRTASMDSVNTQPNLTPLQAQPVGAVASSQLPDPTTSTTSQFPDKPTTDTAMATGTGDTAAAATALDVKKESMVGNWRVANGPSSCDMFLTLTNLGSGSRGGTRGCAGELTAMTILANKTVCDKKTGAVDYYDDDHETVVLTHRLEEDASTCTRTVN